MIALIIQGVKYQLSDRKWVIFNIIFPIVLIALLGYFMTNVFGGEFLDDYDEIRILMVSNSQKTQYIGELLEDNFEEAVINREDSFEVGKKKILEGEFDVLLYFDKDEIQVYSTNEYINKKNIVILNINSIINMTQVPHLVIVEGLLENKSQGIEYSLNSFDYYGVVVLTMMSLYVMIVPLSIFTYDNENNIKERILMTGYSDFEYYTSRMISAIIVQILIIFPIFIITIIGFNTNWGEHPMRIFSYFIINIIMAVSIGTFIYENFKNYEKSLMIIQTVIIPLLSFLGGSYLKISSNNRIINGILNFSPLRWLNQGIMEAIYIGRYETINKFFIIALSVTGLFLVLFILQCRSRRASE